MVGKLGARILTFPGLVNHVRCFDHVLALGGKSVVSPFDIPKRNSHDPLDDAAQSLLDLADGLELEEETSRILAGEDDDTGDDNLDGWIDEVQAMSEEEREELHSEAVPVRTVLVKVRQSLCLCNLLYLCPGAHS